MSEPLRTMYPPIEPYDAGFLKVSSIHTLYFEESGNPNGKPVLFVHGGPGAGTNPSQRQFFDPAFYRIILFDQRGSGQSTPHACLDENTTWDLVSDIEKLRNHLGIQNWLVFGGSWGSTLALAYAQSHPECVKGLILRGIFLCRNREIEWTYQDGVNRVFPEAFEVYEKFIPMEERGDLLLAYHKRLMSSVKQDQLAAAIEWTKIEAKTNRLFEDEDSVKSMTEDHFALAFARIENHYFSNRAFLKSDTQLLDDVHKISHLPCVIVQGRYDMVCPAESAWLLHKAWPGSILKMVPDAGHSATEPGISRELLNATDHFKRIWQLNQA